MIEEFLKESEFSTTDKIVILGDVTTTNQLYRKAKNRELNVKRSNDIGKFKKILQKYKQIINERKYIFILTDKKYLQWMEILDNNEIPCKQYIVLPLFLVDNIRL